MLLTATSLTAQTTGYFINKCMEHYTVLMIDPTITPDDTYLDVSYKIILEYDSPISGTCHSVTYQKTRTFTVNLPKSSDTYEANMCIIVETYFEGVLITSGEFHPNFCKQPIKAK